MLGSAITRHPGCGAEPAVPEHHRGHAGRGDQQHAHLAEGVPGADVDQDDVHRVRAVSAVVGRIGQQRGDRDGVAGSHGERRDRRHRRTHRHRQRRPRQPQSLDRRGAGLGWQCPQHQHEHHQQDRLDQELRQRQIRGAVQREHHTCAVAGQADQQHHGQPVAGDGRAQRRGDDQHADHRLQGRIPGAELDAVACPPRQHRQRQQHQRRHDGGLDRRDRAALRHPGGSQREAVGGTHHRVVAFVGVAE